MAKGNVLNTADEYLKFIQDNFNVGKSSSGIVNSLLEFYKINKDTEAKILAESFVENKIISDFSNYNKFDKLGNFGVNNIENVYSVAEDIIKDINNAKDWLNSYIKWLNSASLTDHDKLLSLGLSILGRAVELCPIDTGFLRKSAVLVDLGKSVIIAFTAPYASYVHDNMSISHPMHGDRNCGGRAKFLELAVQEFFPNKQVWVDVKGYGGVEVEISLNNKVTYRHYK